MEAYTEIYAPEEIEEATAMAKRGHDETAIRQKIAKSTGGGAAADRATKLADKPTYGDSGKQKARENLARKQRGDFRKTTSSSPGLHGYGHKSNDPEVKAKQAARGAQRGALTPDEKKRLNREEFELWVNELVEEGHDLSDYTWDEVYEFYLDEASRADEFTRAAIARNSGRKGGITFEPGPNWDASANRGKGAHISPKQKEKQRRKALRQEELDIFDIVLEFLCVEGYAETLEEAEWIMANELDSEDIEEILEAEGSYGQTPKARAAMSKLAISRMNKPASEYSQKGEKTKKMKAAQKQTRRQDVLSRGSSGGKKSYRPSSVRGKMDADERSERRAERAFDGENTYGAGSVTKNPKKLRKQKAMGEHD